MQRIHLHPRLKKTMMHQGLLVVVVEAAAAAAAAAVNQVYCQPAIQSIISQTLTILS